MFRFAFLVSAVIFVLIDSMYLSFIQTFFNEQITRVQGSSMKLNVPALMLSYIFLILGLNYFIIEPHKSAQEAFLLGIIIYGVFETTNYALFKNWSLVTVLVDTLWGGCSFAITTYLVNILRKWLPLK